MLRLFLIAFLLRGMDGNILSTSSSTSSQIPTVISIVSCNSSENHLPRPEYQIAHTASSHINANSNYFNPSVLNHAPSRFSSSSEEYMDIGNRIQAPMSNFANRIPSRFNVPISSGQNNFILQDQVEQSMHVEDGVKFYLFTRKNNVVSQELKIREAKSLNESHFSPALETKLIFHGFTDVDAAGEWVNVLKETYLAVSNVNLIVADFSSFPMNNLVPSSLPVFTSRKLSEFITFLSTEAGVPLNSIHIIARSYGCHIVGLSGRQLNGQLGRITALEPSPKIAIGGSGSSTYSELKLSKNDALFVDVIHVNGKRFFFHGPQFGLTAPLGHVDVYPNVAERGLGCPGENINFRRYSLRFCHLGRGVRYFTQSIKYPDMYPMCQCASFENYKSGFCSCHQRETRRFLGEILNTTYGVFQLASVPQQDPSVSYYSSFPSTVYG